MKNVNFTRNTYIFVKILCRQIIVMVIQMVFSKVHPACHNIVNGIKPCCQLLKSSIREMYKLFIKQHGI